MNIALSQRILYHKGRAYDSVEHGWYSYLPEHTLFFIPNHASIDFDRWADDIDLLIITGGDDSPLRRRVETAVATRMLARQKPVIGVCHGCFLLQDLLGGHIIEVSGHMDVEHVVKYKDGVHRVNSHHTLAVDCVSSTSRTLATDSDGHCEAWIDGVLAGVAWHPERMHPVFLPEEIQEFFTT